ncbi:MAG: squalene/phytoene synthase family protein, partial [Rhodospirillales bacterium]|nr:squalene/phytoene synthase family protein [Rhodospirillales bacterium]
LRRPLVSYWAMRYGADLKTPIAGIHGPKVMLIDETAGSGADMLPWMFRRNKLGPLVGKRTWGGLVGILGYPVLMDGGMVTAPNAGIWAEEGWVAENVGVAPDVEVEQLPADVMAAHGVGHDDLARTPPSPAVRTVMQTLATDATAWLPTRNHPRLPRHARAAALPAVLARRDLARPPTHPRSLGDRLAVLWAFGGYERKARGRCPLDPR